MIQETRKLLFTAKPLYSRLIAKFIKTPRIFDIAQTIKLSPEVSRFSPAIICIQDEFSRAFSAIPTSTLEFMKSMIPEGNHYHGATIAYCLKKALIADGSTYSGLYYSNEIKNKDVYFSQNTVSNTPIFIWYQISEMSYSLVTGL